MKRENYIIISLLIIVIVLLLFKQPFISLDTDNLISVLGLTITAIAFAVGAYFALMAISVYSRFREIDSVKREVTELKDETFKIKKESLAVCKTQLSSLDEFLTHQISLTYGPYPNLLAEEYIGYFEQRRIELYKQRALISLKYKHIDSYTRQKRIRELKAVLDDQIIHDLKQVVNDENEYSEIRDMAREILKS